MNRVKKNDTKCSNCGLSREKMEAMLSGEDKKPKEAEKPQDPVVKEQNGGIKIDTGAIMKEEQSEQNPAQDSVKEKPEEEKDEAPDVEKGINSDEIGKVVYEEKRKRHKHKSKNKEDEPNYTVDENGEYNIDTHDVTFLEDVEAPTYSVKKARGEYQQEKLKWWEIYKWADRMLAKRKIMKEVNKASRKTPVAISRVWMTILCLFFGYMGAHSLYGKNYKRGFTSLGLFTTAIIVISVPVLYKYVGLFIGGGCGFISVAMWVYDLIMLAFNRYRYRISKEEFISNLNVETRAKIGKKYIAFDRTVFKANEEKRLRKYNKKRNKKLKNERG